MQVIRLRFGAIVTFRKCTRREGVLALLKGCQAGGVVGGTLLHNPATKQHEGLCVRLTRVEPRHRHKKWA